MIGCRTVHAHQAFRIVFLSLLSFASLCSFQASAQNEGSQIDQTKPQTSRPGVIPEWVKKVWGNLPPPDPNSITFTGEISFALVEQFISKHENTNATTLVVSSKGGDALASIRFAHWIMDKRLDVEVFGFCASGCANYLLAAGKNKILSISAKVFWHGGLHQKNFREGYSRFLSFDRAVKKLGLAVLSVQGRALYEEDKIFWDTYIYVRNEEDRFVKRAGINEYIYRLGQEPELRSEDCWTASPQVMASFGYKNITSQSNFGTARSFASNPMVPLICKGVTVAFKFDADNQIVVDEN